jgi:hypothetical protein
MRWRGEAIMRWRGELLGAAAVCILAACIIVGYAATTMASGVLSGSAAVLLSAARTRMPSSPVTVVAASAPGDVTAQFAQTLFATAPVVVVTVPDRAPVLAAAAAARAARAPLLLAAPGEDPSLVRAIRSLHPIAVLAVGLSAAGLADLTTGLPGVRVVSSARGLPVTGVPVPLRRVAVLVRATAGRAVSASTASAESTAVGVTAQAAGAAVIRLAGPDPRADPAAIESLARQRPRAVIAVGAQFGPVQRLASRLAVAETGRQLPGGGQVLFPGRRLVALYGYPGTPSLGALGQQGLTASIARVRQIAARYRPLSSVPVVPTLEIIATVAQGSPGPAGTYSYETPVSELRPWVHQATADGLYVVLDLQPGRANLLQQAKLYKPLLELPDVGLALDPEWKLQPGQKPLQQIGHVGIGEVNSVVRWLGALTARYRLPQKLLVLHQFELSMLQGEQDLDTSHDDLSIVIHMDGQGTPASKQATWNAVIAAAPAGVRFGWKNFLVKDHPMLTPSQTMARTPVPVMITYQ